MQIKFFDSDVLQHTHTHARVRAWTVLWQVSEKSEIIDFVWFFLIGELVRRNFCDYFDRLILKERKHFSRSLRVEDAPDIKLTNF